MSAPLDPTVLKPVPPNILVVDDDVALGDFVSRVLQEAGYAAEQCVTPLKALPLLRGGDVALVLLDHSMPGMDGLQLLEEIRKESNVPVVMLTGSDKSSLAVRAIRLGAFDYLVKPVEEKRLLDTVKQALESGAPAGNRIAQYEIERELGRGGMGVVYSARDPRLDRSVALKVLLPELAADPAYELQFLAESRMAAKFSHPNIVTVYEAGRFRGQLFMAMEFVRGELLETYVHNRNALPPARVFEIGGQVASALEVLHGAGLVHRDLKPSNLMITSGSVVKVLDFGLARPNEPIDPNAKFVSADASGTLAYTAPELLTLGQVDARGDIYALGLVLYELLTGVRAFDSESMTDLMFRICEAKFSKPLREITGVPREAVDLLQGMLETKPENRIATIGEVRGRLAALRRLSGDRRAGR